MLGMSALSSQRITPGVWQALALDWHIQTYTDRQIPANAAYTVSGRSRFLASLLIPAGVHNRDHLHVLGQLNDHHMAESPSTMSTHPGFGP